jgi:deazaflavin-dependent oxidoreductase (nitroreductase family)
VGADGGNLAHSEFCYLTTTGRRTGARHTIEMWFALNGSTLYLLSGDGVHEKSDWVRNLLKDPNVSVRVEGRDIDGTARLIRDEIEDALARRLVVEKYQPGYGEDLSEWRVESLPVAVDLDL